MVGRAFGRAVNEVIQDSRTAAAARQGQSKTSHNAAQDVITGMTIQVRTWLAEMILIF